MKKQLVVFVFAREGKPGGNRYDGFARKLQAAGGLPDCDVLTVALENLAFCISENYSADVLDTVSGRSLGDASLVYFKSWESMPEEAGALAEYLSAQGIPYMDSLVKGMGFSKLPAAFRLWGRGLPNAETIYVRRGDRLLDFLHGPHGACLGEHFIAKDVMGEKGRDNYLLTLSDLQQVMAKDPERHFICQRYIPNDGDYRIGVYGEKSRFVIRRRGAEGTHLNNTSAGGQAEYMPLSEVDAGLLGLAEQAAGAAGLQIAGVDLIIDKQSGKPYVLEVNQGSQIVSGAFVDKNIAAFNKGLAAVLPQRYARAQSAQKNPLRIIGRRSIVALPGLGVVQAVAKIDTGAYSSSLHAENIRVEHSEGGQPELCFDVTTTDKLRTVGGKKTAVRIREFTQKEVRSSNGQWEQRYAIKTDIHIDSRDYPVVLTLTDRSQMEYPVLLGRHLLRSRFLVNVELSQDNLDA